LREEVRRIEVELENKKRDYLDLNNEFETRIYSLKKEMEKLEG
jgi:uncharacterized small protein (DUF1192 family)